MDQSVIDKCIELGKTYDPDRLTGAAKATGIDPSFGSSEFAVVMTALQNNRIEVLYADSWAKVQLDDAVDDIVKLMAKRYCKKAFVDNNNPEVVRALKRAVSEDVNYERIIADLRSRKIDEKYWPKWFNINVKSFAQSGKSMLSHLKYMVDSGLVAINPVKFPKLLTAMRMASASEYKLNKADMPTGYDDLIDAFMLSVSYYSIPRPERAMYPMKK